MPTASSFSFTFPWEEMVGGFNAFITMMTTPIALAIGLILAVLVAGLTISLVKRARGHA